MNDQHHPELAPVYTGQTIKTKTFQFQLSISNPLTMSSSEGTKLVKRQLTKDEWDALKPDIRKLYIDENKSFSQVSSVLKNDHQFNPTLVLL